jgi:hypothetical protein
MITKTEAKTRMMAPLAEFEADIDVALSRYDGHPVTVSIKGVNAGVVEAAKDIYAEKGGWTVTVNYDQRDGDYIQFA